MSVPRSDSLSYWSSHAKRNHHNTLCNGDQQIHFLLCLPTVAQTLLPPYVCDWLQVGAIGTKDMHVSLDMLCFDQLCLSRVYVMLES